MAQGQQGLPAWMKDYPTKGKGKKGIPAWMGGMIGGGYGGQVQTVKNRGGNRRVDVNGQMISMTPGMIYNRTRQVDPLQQMLQQLLGRGRSDPSGIAGVRG